MKTIQAIFYQDKNSYYDDSSICEVQIRINDNFRIQKRTYRKISELFAITGRFSSYFLNAISSSNLKFTGIIKRSKFHPHYFSDFIIRNKDKNKNKIIKVAIEPLTNRFQHILIIYKNSKALFLLYNINYMK